MNGTTVTLDAAGNLLSDGTLNYTWDASGRLKTVSKANKLWATYYYDYKSRRTRKETTSRAPQGAQVVVYHYNQDDNLLAETLATGAPLKTYIWDDGRLVGLLDHGTAPPTLLTLDLDQLGTPRAARNANGTVVWRWDSDGYGTTLPNEDPDGNGTKTTIHLRFPGQYYDQESGLHYNWNRYYSPRLGRYISADPIGLDGGPNLYTYVGGNPIGYSDPFGLDRQATGPAVVINDMSGGRTVFFDPQNPSSYTEIQSSNEVTRAAHARDADTPYHGKVTICQRGRLGAPYGTAKLRTTDPRSRWVHGGGSGLPDPYAPQQGWKPTEGCTRAQNEDVEELCDVVEEYQQSHPGVQIPYGRF